MSVRYRGYVYDHETGLYYLQSRYYDPETGRFLNADDVDYIGYSGEDVSYNMFAYCENNAVNFSDSFGYASYRIFSVGHSWNRIIDSLLRNCSVLYKNRAYYLDSATIYYKLKKVSILFYNYSNFNTYLKKRAQEIYFYKTYAEWCYYISVDNKNILKRYSRKAIERVAKSLMKLDKSLDFDEAKEKIEHRIDEMESVLVPLIDDSYSLNIGLALDVISIASDLIDRYYKKFSKEVKYISKILSSIGKKYRNDKYFIFIPYYIYYDTQTFYEMNFGRTGVRWIRSSTYRFYKK